MPGGRAIGGEASSRPLREDGAIERRPPPRGLRPDHDRGGEGGEADAGGDVEPEVVPGCHHREPDPARPERPEQLRAPPLDEAAIAKPRMSASAAWMLGMAANWFDASCTRPLPWFSAEEEARVSTKPHSGKRRGG